MQKSSTGIIPSETWPLRTASLTGNEHLLKQNPENDTFPEEERIPTSLILQYVQDNFIVSGISITGGTVTGTDLLLHRAGSSDVIVDVSVLLDNVEVVSGAVIGTDIVLTKSDASTVIIDISSIDGATNLTYTASPTNGVVNSDTGSNATIPLANNTNAGLESPANNIKLGHITVTQAVNLDQMEADIIVSGTVVGNDIVLTQADATTITITDGAKDARFRGIVADATAVNAIATPQNGDIAFVTNTNTLSGGSSGVAGHCHYNGAAWVVYSLVSAGGTAQTHSSVDSSVDINEITPGNFDYAMPSPLVDGVANPTIFDMTVSGGFLRMDLKMSAIPRIYKYDAGNGCIVRATGLGATFVRTTASTWTLTFPTGVEPVGNTVINSSAAESATAALTINILFPASSYGNTDTSNNMTDLDAPMISTIKKVTPGVYPTTAASNNPSWTVTVPVSKTVAIETTEFTEVGGGGGNATSIILGF